MTTTAISNCLTLLTRPKLYLHDYSLRENDPDCKKTNVVTAGKYGANFTYKEFVRFGIFCSLELIIHTFAFLLPRTGSSPPGLLFLESTESGCVRLECRRGGWIWPRRRSHELGFEFADTLFSSLLFLESAESGCVRLECRRGGRIWPRRRSHVNTLVVVAIKRTQVQT